MPVSVDKTKPYAFEVALRLVRGDSVVFASHYNGKGEAMRGFKIDARGVRPAYFTGGGSGQWANAGPYASNKPRTGKPMVLRVSGEKVSNGPYTKLRLIYAINGAVIAKDDNAAEADQVALVVAKGATIEVRRYEEQGTAIQKVAASRLIMSTSSNIREGDKTRPAFKAGESIFGTVWMPKPFVNIAGSGTRVKIVEAVSVNGKEVSTYSWTPDARGVARQGTRYDVAFAPAAGKAKYPNESYQLSKRLAELPGGVYKIGLLVRFQPMNQSMMTDLAATEFSFDNRDAKGRKAFAKMVASYREALLAQTKLPKSQMNNGQLEKDVAAAIKKAGWKQKVVKVVLMERDWGTLKHRTFGHVLQRTLNVGVGTKDRKGDCMVFFVTVFQKRKHGNAFEKTITLGGTHRIEAPIACANLR
mgnify:FL=1